MALRETRSSLTLQGMTLQGMTLCLVVTSLMGCQSMMNGKSKAKDSYSHDKFSCGEPLPGQRQAPLPQSSARR